ncbi:hypothetical protein CYR55_10075 [Chimaeribacter californicus]|uniref:Histidine kinase n=2 Tax=Chimaeribacter californicus TaxID=2060067 RepID=A0A2N5E728_9GAMM|nr:hypothetical protein CYR55_10075 [Chimaeribacter californicus]
MRNTLFKGTKMNKQPVSAEHEIAQYFNNPAAMSAAESEVVAQIVAELLKTHEFVTNKAIIANLIEKLETEHDVVKLDVYRHALEAMILKAPDETFA